MTDQDFAAIYTDAPPQDRPELLRKITDPLAAGWFAQQRSGPHWAPDFGATIPELASCALLMMVKDEDDIISQNLEHHYRLGFRRFFVLDNASTDRTATLITEFRDRHADAHVFYAYDFITAYFQEVKMNALAAFVEAYLCKSSPPLDWLFYVDADEFITPCLGDASIAAFRSALADSRYKVIILHWVQSASDQALAHINGVYTPHLIFRNQWTRMQPAVPKVAHRAWHNLSTIQGNHTTRTFPHAVEEAAVMAAHGVYIMHFPMRTLTHLRKKIVNGGRAYEAAPELIGLGNHWKAYYQSYQTHGDALLVQLLWEHIRACQPSAPAEEPARGE